MICSPISNPPFTGPVLSTRLPLGAWYFNTDGGSQVNDGKVGLYYAWAVRSGDVAAVPEPGVIGLFGIGALAWAGAKARRRG